MARTPDIGEFLEQLQSRPGLLVDVRAPKEYQHGHMPGALNLALFDDEARAAVGTAYKQQGHDAAIRLGLQLVGPKAAGFVEWADAHAPHRRIYMHCWRGGMRSAAMAYLLQFAGFEVHVLQGGYKAYRRAVLQYMERPWRLIVLAGMTGSGKTDILQQLAAMGQQVLDLEHLARHKGSAFGALFQPAQPTVEQFENDLFAAMQQLDINKPVWVEDESHAIGRVYLPMPFWQRMLQSPVIAIEAPSALRISRLVAEYASAPAAELAASLEKIRKRLGGQHYQRALAALEAQDFHLGAAIALEYYDKSYRHGLSAKNGPMLQLPVERDDPAHTAQMALERAVQQGWAGW